MKTCPKCGAENGDSKKFCESCGAELGKAGVRCPKCGAEVEAGKKFCGECGASIAAAAAAEQQGAAGGGGGNAEAEKFFNRGTVTRADIIRCLRSHRLEAEKFFNRGTVTLKGLDYFKATPKTNCKACGKPSCMAFGMDVPPGKITIDKCPYIDYKRLNELAEGVDDGTGIFDYV